MNHFVCNSIYIEHTPSVDVDAGEGVVQNQLVGFARKDISADDLGELQIKGRIKLAKTGGSSGETHAVGQYCYWDDTSDVVTTTKGSNKFLGIIVKAAASTATEVEVELLPGGLAS